MAQQLKTFPLINKPTSRFDRFLNGKIWKLDVEEDLQLTTYESARYSLRRRAKERGQVCRFASFDAELPTIIIVQASAKTSR
jgi:hypothetical protein